MSFKVSPLASTDSLFPIAFSLRGTGHPYEPTLAVSGIDSTIKIFSPDRHAQENARRGIHILDPDNPANVLGSTFGNVGGLQTRRCIEDSYRIMSQNDVERQGGVSDAHITVRIRKPALKHTVPDALTVSLYIEKHAISTSFYSSWPTRLWRRSRRS